jgi:hypothetical protein
MSFAGYVARTLIGDQYGYPVTGLLGGLVSSTSVTLTLSRLSRAPVLVIARPDRCSPRRRCRTAASLIDDKGFRAGVRFAVMAFLVLPLLPQGPLQADGRPAQRADQQSHQCFVAHVFQSSALDTRTRRPKIPHLWGISRAMRLPSIEAPQLF